MPKNKNAYVRYLIIRSREIVQGNLAKAGEIIVNVSCGRAVVQVQFLQFGSLRKSVGFQSAEICENFLIYNVLQAKGDVKIDCGWQLFSYVYTVNLPLALVCLFN